MSDAQKNIERGEAARRLVEDETFLAGLRAVEADALRAFRESTTPDQAWAAHLELMAAQKLGTWLRIAVTQGVAEMQRLKEEERRERANERAEPIYDIEEAKRARAEHDKSKGGEA